MDRTKPGSAETVGGARGLGGDVAITYSLHATVAGGVSQGAFTWTSFQVAGGACGRNILAFIYLFIYWCFFVNLWSCFGPLPPRIEDSLPVTSAFSAAPNR